jgi:hypothetical protein
MKIGMSFSRCVYSISKGEVAYDDVLVVIASTSYKDATQIQKDWDYLSRMPEFHGADHHKCAEIANRLFREGKLHQPRLYGVWRGPIEQQYVWLDLVPTALEDHASVRDAWNQYRLMLSLTAEKLPSAEDANDNLNPSAY